MGCGQRKRGTIGIDIKKISKVDIVCDAHNMSLRDAILDGRPVYNVLERTDSPILVLKGV